MESCKYQYKCLPDQGKQEVHTFPDIFIHKSKGKVKQYVLLTISNGYQRIIIDLFPFQLDLF